MSETTNNQFKCSKCDEIQEPDASFCHACGSNHSQAPSNTTPAGSSQAHMGYKKCLAGEDASNTTKAGGIFGYIALLALIISSLTALYIFRIEQKSKSTPAPTVISQTLPNPNKTVNSASSRMEQQAVINDPDGYTNVRSGPGKNYSIIDKVYNDEIFWVEIPSSGGWRKIRTRSGKSGFMHNSRINIVP